MKKLFLILTLSQVLNAGMIHDAVKTGDIKEVKLALKQSLIRKINSTDKHFGQTPLYIAAENNFVDIVLLLIERGADLNIPNTDKCRHGFSVACTPLHVSARNGNIQIVNLLINNGANVNAKDSVSNTALHLAAEYGHIEIVKLLINNPLCDHELIDRLHKTPKDIAKNRNNLVIVEILKKALPVDRKIIKSEHGSLKHLIIKYFNKIGITQKEKDNLPIDIKNYLWRTIHGQ